MLKAIIGQMGRHIDRLNDTERGLIDAAVNAEWEKNGAEGSIDGVIEALIARQHIQGEELAIAMRPFSSAGTYGRFFTGQSTLKIGADLTVFELSDLSARERSEEHTSELQSLMRTTYAVFCLKKNKTTHTTTLTPPSLTE